MVENLQARAVFHIFQPERCRCEAGGARASVRFHVRVPGPNEFSWNSLFVWLAPGMGGEHTGHVGGGAGGAVKG